MPDTIVSSNRTALVVLATLAVLVGMIPYALFVGLEIYLPLFALIVAPTTWSEIRKFESSATEAPTLGEMLLGAWGAASNGAIVSLMALSAYFLVWIVGLVFDLEIGTVAFWIAFAVALFFSFAMSFVAGEDLPRKLYPDFAGSGTVYYALLTERRRLFSLIALAIVALAALFFFFDRDGWVLASALVVFVIFTSMPLVSLEHGERGSPDKAKALAAVARALESAGFTVIQSPRTGRQDIDPLVATVDLLAQNEDRSMVVEVKAGAHKPNPVEWREAAALRMGARAFEQVMNETAEQPVNVRALMVFVDRKRSEGLDLFLDNSDLSVVDLPATAIQAVSDESGKADLEALAGLLLPDQPRPRIGAA